MMRLTIFMLPHPSIKKCGKKLFSLIDAKPDWVAPDGWVIVQIHPREYEVQSLTHFDLIDERKYSNTLLLFYEKKVQSENSDINSPESE